MNLPRAWRRLLALFRRGRLERELENEILAHLELAERDALARGLPAEEARRAARLNFGGIDQMKEEHHDQRSFRWVENLLGDLRYGLACLLRAPAFTATVVSVLALGIGANVAMFSVVDAVLLQPLPFAQPERIVGVWEAPRPGIVNATSAPDFLDWQRMAAPVFEALSAEQSLSAALTGPEGATRLSGKAVTAEYFQVFATGALLGRTFTAGRRNGRARGSRDRSQPRRLAERLRRRPRHSAAPSDPGWRAAPGDRSAGSRCLRSRRDQVLETAGLHAGPAGA